MKQFVIYSLSLGYGGDQGRGVLGKGDVLPLYTVDEQYYDIKILAIVEAETAGEALATYNREHPAKKAE